MVKVSVIIPAYNAEKYIGEAINSVLSQMYTDFEVIVIDDGSTDETQARVKEFGELVSYYYKQNNGPASARNFGVKKAKGEFIAFLDADDLWEPEKLEKQLNFLNRHPEIVLVCSAIYSFGTRSKTYYLLSTKTHQGNLFRSLFLKSFIHTSSVIIKKKAIIEDVGGFKEEYRWGEDYDLWLRIAKRFPIAYLGEPLVRIRSHEQNISKAKISLRQNAIKIIKEYYDPRYISKSDYHKRLSELTIYLGRNYLKKGAKQEARAHFKDAVKLDPFRPRAWRYLFKSWVV